MDVRIEITGDRLVCKQGGHAILSTSVHDFVAALQEGGDHLALPQPIPDGVRVVRSNGRSVVLVIQDGPQVRTVRWLAEDSQHPKGAGATYQTACLAFPFVVLVVSFHDGALGDYHQCFYRTAPIDSLDDPLFMPNLYNVAPTGSQACWLCLIGLRTDLGPLSWEEKVRAIRSHLWGAGFNRSTEMGGRSSYWELMRKLELDPRLASVGAWEQATRHDPLFPLEIAWRPAGTTVREAVAQAMASALTPAPPACATELAALVAARCQGAPTTRRKPVAAKR